MMFEKSFQWAIQHGARVLFAFAILYTIAAVVSDLFLLAQKFGAHIEAAGANFSSYTPTETILLALLGPFATPASLLFSALVVNHLDYWARERRDGKR